MVFSFWWTKGNVSWHGCGTIVLSSIFENHAHQHLHEQKRKKRKCFLDILRNSLMCISIYILFFLINLIFLFLHLNRVGLRCIHQIACLFLHTIQPCNTYSHQPVCALHQLVPRFSLCSPSLSLTDFNFNFSILLPFSGRPRSHAQIPTKARKCTHTHTNTP